MSRIDSFFRIFFLIFSVCFFLLGIVVVYWGQLDRDYQLNVIEGSWESSFATIKNVNISLNEARAAYLFDIDYVYEVDDFLYTGNRSIYHSDYYGLNEEGVIPILYNPLDPVIHQLRYDVKQIRNLSYQGFFVGGIMMMVIFGFLIMFFMKKFLFSRILSLCKNISFEFLSIKKSFLVLVIVIIIFQIWRNFYLIDWEDSHAIVRSIAYDHRGDAVLLLEYSVDGKDYYESYSYGEALLFGIPKEELKEGGALRLLYDKSNPRYFKLLKK